MELYKTEKYVISYIDLLGVSETIMNSNNDEYLFIMRNIYQDIIQFVANKKYWNQRDMEIKIFSDNILVAARYGESDYSQKKSLLNVLIASRMFQINSLIYGKWLSRGYILLGDIYIDDIYVCGKGLLDAYYGENHIASYPRIIISDDIRKLADMHGESKRICKDFDGEYFIHPYYGFIGNYSQFSSFYSEDAVKVKLKELMDTYNTCILSISNLRYLQKIRWQINLHNEFCIKHGYDDYKICKFE